MIKLLPGARILFLVFVVQAVASEQLNLAIVYDENEGVAVSLGDNIAMSISLSDLFRSQATPILVPGNLALRIALFLATPQAELLEEKYERRFEKIVRDQKQMEAIASKSERQEKKSQLCSATVGLKKELKTDYAMFKYSRAFKKDAKYATIGQATTYLNMMRFLESVCSSNKCPSSIDDITSYVKSLFYDVNLRDWYIYHVKNTPQHLMLFIPRLYAQKHFADEGDRADVKKLGFDHNNLELVIPKNLASVATGYSFDPQIIATSLKIPFDKNTEKRWNIYINGHGASAESGTTSAQLLLKKFDVDKSKIEEYVKEHPGKPVPKNIGETQIKTSSLIAGMPTSEFLKLLDWWTQLPTNVVVYSTCFGGGLNAEAINQLFTISVSLAQKVNADKHFPVVISLAGSEQSILILYKASYKDFFDTIGQAFALSSTSREQQRNLLRAAVQHITKNTPIILFPRQIQPLEVVASQEPAARVKLLVAALAKKMEEQKRQAPEIGQFTYLVAPTYQFVTSEDGQLKLEGTLVNPETIEITDAVIKFKDGWNKLDSRIVLNTENITKKLIFEGDVPSLNFDIKTASDHITFKNVELPDTELRYFLTSAFSEYGRALQVNIDTCTALIRSISNEPVTVTDVVLYSLPYYLVPHRGYLLFAYNNAWHIFELSKEKDKITLVSLATVDIPAEKVQKEELQSNILKQFELNGKLAYAVWSKNATEIAQWFGESQPYPAILPRMILKKAFNFKGVLERVSMLLGQEQTKNVEHTLALIGDTISKQDAGIFSLDELLDKLGRLYGDKLVKAIGKLSDEQKNNVLSAALVAGDSRIAAALFEYGMDLPKTPINSEILADVIDLLYEDDLTRIINQLSEQQKSDALAAALSSGESTAACALIDVGTKIPVAVSADAIVETMSDDLWSKNIADKLIDQLSDEQKSNVLNAALVSGKSQIVADLLKHGMDLPKTPIRPEVLVNIIDRLYGDDLTRIVNQLSEQQKSDVLLMAVLSEKFDVVDALMATGAKAPE